VVVICQYIKKRRIQDDAGKSGKRELKIFNPSNKFVYCSFFSEGKACSSAKSLILCSLTVQSTSFFAGCRHRFDGSGIFIRSLRV